MAENDFLASLDREPGLFSQLRAVFHGPIGRLTMFVYAIALATFALTIWIAVRMFDAADSRELILWTAAAFVCWTSLVTMKLWIWNRVNTLAILRALHRAQAG
jgi:hypothetical protein